MTQAVMAVFHQRRGVCGDGDEAEERRTAHPARWAELVTHGFLYNQCREMGVIYPTLNLPGLG